MLQMMNQEIIKMRKELHFEHQHILFSFFSENEIKMALQYFLSLPISETLDKKSFEVLMECCEEARRFLKQKGD